MADSLPKDPLKSSTAASQARDLAGKFSKIDPPLISFSVTNPVTYLRRFWKGVMASEGVDIRLKIHPMTAVMIILAVGGVSFGIGRISIPEPVIQYLPILATPTPTPFPTATPQPLIQAALVGTLQQQGDRFFLIGGDTQAIRLEIPPNVLIVKLIGKKILASGLYDRLRSVLLVEEASDLAIISGSMPVPTSSVTPTPSPASADAL